MKLHLARVAILVLALVTGNIHSAENLYTIKPSRLPELAKPGEFTVGVKTLSVSNPGQLSMTDFSSKIDRSLTLEVWYPGNAKDASLATYKNETRLGKSFEIQGKAYRDVEAVKNQSFPLVVLSHGYTGYRTIMYYLGEHLASHGYVVAAIDHTDSTNAEIDFQNAPFAGFPSTLMNRARDQQFVLDKFSENGFEFASIVDNDRAAVIGYSMGGYGAVNTVGGCYQFSKESLMQLGYPEDAATGLAPLFSFCHAGRASVDPRWKAMIAFAPWGQELQLHAPDALSKIKVPTLYVSGDHDDISGHEHGVKKLFEQTSPADNYLLTYREARHNIATHPAPEVAHAEDIDLGHYEEPAWDVEVINHNNEHFALAFLDCYVKGDKARCEYLPKRENSNQVKQPDGKLTPTWPGFPDRWATGMSFERGDKDAAK